MLSVYCRYGETGREISLFCYHLVVCSTRPFFQPSSHIALIDQSVCSRTTGTQKKNMDGDGHLQQHPSYFFQPFSHIVLVYKSFCSRTIADQL